MPTLVLSPRPTPDGQRLWRAAGRRGWRVERLPTCSAAADLRGADEPVVHVEALVAPLVAACLGVPLDEPPADWLPNLPDEYRQRRVRLGTAADARRLAAPMFVKPPNDKSFEARVYAPGELPADLPADAPVLIAEPVGWEVEFRCFVLDRRVAAFSVYLRDGMLRADGGFASTDAEDGDVLAFMARLLADRRVPLPPAVVVDVGKVRGRGWAAVELNAAWASGLYGGDPDGVLDALRAGAAGPRR